MAEKTPLQIFYDNETNQLENDVAYLDTQLDKYDDHINGITPLANPSDEAYAQTVMDANRYLSQAINFGVVATGCGCSVAIGNTSDFQLGIAATVFYEIAQNVMDNNSYDGYDGDDPLGDASPTNLTDGSGGSTTLNPSNYGRGIDNQIGTGSSEILLYIYAIQSLPGICTQSCSALYSEQQSALNSYNDAKASGPRSQYAATSRSIKEEAAEYRKQSWAYGRGRRTTLNRKERIANFYPNAGPSGINT